MVLQSIRDRLNGIVAIFILALLIIPFAFVGVSSYFTSDAVNSVAVVNDQEITIGEFTQSFQNYRRRMQSLLGANFDAEQFDQAIVRRQHLDNLIDEELLSQASVDAGLSVTNERLAQAIRDVPAFQVDGQFNADVYQSRLQSQGMSPAQFDNDMRVQLVVNQFPTVISQSAVSTDWELNQYVRLQDQKRAFSAIIVPAQVEDAISPPDEAAADESADMVDEAASAAEEIVAETADGTVEELIDEEAILAWYEGHLDEYRSEEQVIIEYLELDAATMPGAVEPDEEILKSRFEDQAIRFITPESRQASHILIEVDTQAPDAEIETARQQAAELAQRAIDGEDFAELAREYSSDAGSAPDGGDLGWVDPGFMVQAFEDGLYELSLENPISEPVQSGFGWHVIYLRDIRPSEGMTYSEAREILLEEYRAEADDRRFLEQADRLVDIIYEDPTTLETAAEALGLEVQEAGPFGRAGGIEGISTNPVVANAAFSDTVLIQRVASDPVDIAENHMVMILLKQHIPEDVLPLEDVRERVVASLRQARAMDAARSSAETLLAELSADGDIAVLAEQAGYELLALEAATRVSPEIQPALRDRLFQMEVPEEGGSTYEIVELNNGFAVVRLESVTDGALTEEEALRGESYRRRIANATASSEAYAFLRMLRSQSKIEVFEDRL